MTHLTRLVQQNIHEAARLCIRSLVCTVGFFAFLVVPSLSKAAPVPAKSSKLFLWVEGPTQDFKRVGIPVLEQDGKKAFATLSPALFQNYLERGASLIVREAVELPLPKPFLSLAEIEAEMARLAKTYPNHVELVKLSDRFKVPLTVEGRTVLALRIHSKKSSQPAPAVLLDSIHHAREVITPLVMMDAAKMLAEEYGKDPKVTKWVDHYDIWIVPIVNPDGYHYMFTKNPYWRKNRRKNANGTYGVDLNRNYPFFWGKCGNHSANPDSEIYKGKAPASEPEVQALVALGVATQPQLYLTYHSYGNDIVRPYVCATVGDEKLVQAVTQEMATAAGYKFRRASSSGESFEHFYNLYGSLSYLIEVGTVFHPEPADVPTLIARARTTWTTLLERGMQSSILFQVVDKQTKQPLLANIQIDEVKFVNQEIRRTLAQTGFFAWTLIPGSYTVRISASGYKTWTKKLQLAKSSLLRLTVELEAGADVDNEVTVDEQPEGKEPSNEPEASEESVRESLPEKSPAEKAAEAPTEPQNSETSKGNEGNVAPDTSTLEKPAGEGCQCGSAEATSWWAWFLLLLIGLRVRRRYT